MKLSVITTLFMSENYIDEFYNRITKVARELVDSYEIVFVCDGSPDDSLERVVELSRSDSAVKVVELARNHGHHRAMMIGLGYALGDRIFLIDSDLEESPEALSAFWGRMQSDHSIDMVYGIQEIKSGSRFKKFLSSSFYRTFNFFSYVKIPDNELVSRLANRKYVDALLGYNETELFIPGIWADVGFNTTPFVTEKKYDGSSTYSLSKRVKMAVDAITSFSTKPLIYIFYLGTTISSLSLLYIIYLVISRITRDEATLGWTSIVASIYLIGGLTIFSIGVIGVYLSRIFSEVKNRPTSIVRNVYIDGKING